MTTIDLTAELLNSTTAIVAAHVSRNPIAVDDLPLLINQVYNTLANIGSVPDKPNGRPEPAVSIKKSIQPDYIVCLEDGKKLKMLKRYLSTKYNMTADEYRARWGLPPDYPMTAPNYAMQRSQLARDIGLGHRRG